MITANYLYKVADPIVDIFMAMETEIASDIAKNIIRNGALTTAQSYQYMKALELGYVRKDINKAIAQASGKSLTEINKIMSQTVKQLGVGGLTAGGITAEAIANSPALQAIILQGVNQQGMLISNLTKTTASMAEKAYINVLDSAYLKITSGAYDQTEALMQAVDTVASNGINKVAYPSGATQSVEASVRRAVTTGVNQSIAKLQLERCDELETNLVEVSSHAGARPEHAEWQGQIYSLDGKGNYDDFYRATDYGSGEGLCGWNCYHTFWPYTEGSSTRSFSEDPSADAGRDNDEDYAIQQTERRYEREIRAAKKECQVTKSAMEAAKGDKELYAQLQQKYNATQTKLSNREDRLDNFVKSNVAAQNRNEAREHVSNWKN